MEKILKVVGLCLCVFVLSVSAKSEMKSNNSLNGIISTTPSGEFGKNKPFGDDDKKIIGVARDVLIRTLGNKAKNISLGVIDAIEGRDTYEYSAHRGFLTVRGSSAIAITRGVYDYLRDKDLGMVDWVGAEIHLPAKWPNARKKRVTTPFVIRQAYNVVTSGYTTPYWNWDRWECELDWLALHGYNMAMAPMATEAIASRVWKRLGLSQKEINEFYVSPSLLPWQRMGNICQVGGTYKDEGSLPRKWHKDQIALQHKLLKRMRELGIEPVIQSFAGFVPKAITRLYSQVKLHNTLWNAGFSPSQRPVILMPGDSLFAQITKMYMEEWQKEFGTTNYYLVDSFNELELPKTDGPVTSLLAEYGEKTYRSIISGNPDATWVIQGWMFGYQRQIWSPERIKALFSKVPDDKILILDYANDYANSWEPVNGFNGKQWAYGFVPNMGGKTAYTGDMSLYATGAAKTLASPKKNNLVGFSVCGEGLENNAVIYEVMSDAAWSNKPIDLDQWIPKYCINRYGANLKKMSRAWNLLQKSCYKKLIPNPQFGWQQGRCGVGNVNHAPEFFEAVEAFLSCADELNRSPNYRADAIEISALALGIKADQWFQAAAQAYGSGDTLMGGRAGDRGLELLMQLDRLMESHPLNRLERWISFAKSHSDDPQLQKFYESDARRIVTIWGPPVNDYSCRVWSGLVRDFYHGRMAEVLSSLKTGKTFDKASWEMDWVLSSGVSKVKPFEDPVFEAQKLLAHALNEKLPVVNVAANEVIGRWSASNIQQSWKVVEWPISTPQLKKLKGVHFVFMDGKHPLDIKQVTVFADGKEVASDKHLGYAGILNKSNVYLFKIPQNIQGNNGCVIRAVIRTDGGTDSRGRVELIGR